MSELKICPNCGGEVGSDAVKCPYCGYINIEGAENKYFNDLNEIRDDLASVEKEPVKALKKGLSKGTRVILITVSILLVLSALFAARLAYELKDKPKVFLTAEDEAYASAYRAVAEKQMAAAYESKDIAQMAQIYDKAYSQDRVSLWGDPHYETGYASSCYMKLKQCLPNLDKDKLTKHEAEEITYYCFYFYYRAYGSDGAEIFDPLRDDEILPIITGRLGFSIEDMESFRDRVTVPEGVVRSKVYKIVKKNYKNYH
ncbi:MAG: hypothetical protein K6E63_11420 [Lachnospiraceae bacterium]|nr:hypothetical protein [Lachnospiraceae bacterium]